MNKNSLIRPALLASALYNLGGGFLFAFPASLPGQLAGMPADVPMVYRVLLALFVLLFAGAYAWLARQPQIDRPMVAFAAIGKGTAFTLITILWLTGAASGTSVLAAVGDGVFAVIFAWWVWF